MSKSVIAFIATLTSLAFSGPSLAGLDEARKNFTRNFQVPNGARFQESPFNGIYAVEGHGGLTLFDEPVSIMGYQDSWRVADNPAQNHRATNSGESAALRQVLRKNLRSDWMIRSSYGAGGPNIIVISAPNCPACRGMEEDLAKHGGDVAASFFTVPTLLGGASQQFANAVMCSANPALAWKQSFTTQRPLLSPQSCEKSRWAHMVLDNSFGFQNGNVAVRTPAIILPDGTVIYGWARADSAEKIRKKLGL